jgi:hypothetical protein
MGNDFDPESRLKDAEEYLSMLASSPGISAWQVEQATDVLTILLGSVFGKSRLRTLELSQHHH